MDTFRQPSPWQPETNRHKLALYGKLIEELTECAKAAARCIIQGDDECDPETGENNADALCKEFADVVAAVGLVGDYLQLNREKFDKRVAMKQRHLKGWHELIMEDR